MPIRDHLANWMSGKQEVRYARLGYEESRRQTHYSRLSFFTTLTGVFVAAIFGLLGYIWLTRTNPPPSEPSVKMLAYSPPGSFMLHQSKFEVQDLPVVDAAAGCQNLAPVMAEYEGSYPMGPVGTIGVISPSLLSLAIVDIEIEVISRQPLPEDWAYLDCSEEQGGPLAGTILRVDLEDPDGSDAVKFVISESGDDEEVFVVPPGSYDNEGRSYETILLDPDGDPNFTYDYVLKLRVLVDGNEKLVSLGSKERPLRWADWAANGATRSVRWEYCITEWQEPPTFECQY